MKRKGLEFGEQMSSILIRNEKVKVCPSTDGKSLVLEIGLRHAGFMLLMHKLFRLRDRKQYALDAVGRQVYESIDGKKAFEQLIDEFGERYKLTFFESRALLMQYIKMLMSRGLVVVAVKKT
jgi:hypothetical protein